MFLYLTKHQVIDPHTSRPQKKETQKNELIFKIKQKNNNTIMFDLLCVTHTHTNSYIYTHAKFPHSH